MYELSVVSCLWVKLDKTWLSLRYYMLELCQTINLTNQFVCLVPFMTAIVL